MSISSDQINELGSWLRKARKVGFAIGVTAAALLMCFLCRSEPTIRIAGLILQLFGILTVAWGISRTRAQFGRPTLAAKSLSWFRQFPRRKRSTHVAVVNSNLGMLFSRVRAHKLHGVSPDATLAQRVDSLEQNIKLIHDRISGAEKVMDEEVKKVADTLRQESREREMETRLVREKLEATEVGGLDISAIGALWLFVGVVLSTAAPEIFELLT